MAASEVCHQSIIGIWKQNSVNNMHQGTSKRLKNMKFYGDILG